MSKNAPSMPTGSPASSILLGASSCSTTFPGVKTVASHKGGYRIDWEMWELGPWGEKYWIYSYFLSVSYGLLNRIKISIRIF